VTGEKPFPGQNITTVIYKIVNEEPIPPRELDPSINTGLCNVIARALAKDPSARFQTCGELLDALKNYRNFEQELREDLHASYLPAPPAPSKLTLRPAQRRGTYTRPATNIALPDIARAIPVPAAGHTLYTAPSSSRNSKERTWSTFWFSLLLLGVIAATGYYIRPYTDDVWAVMHSVFAKQPVSAQTAPSTPAPVGSAAPAPVVPVKNKTFKPVLSALPAKQDDSDGVSVPTGKSKSADDLVSVEKPKSENSGDGPVKAADPAVPPVADSASSTPPQISSASSPAEHTQAPPRVRMANLKTAIDQRLADAGLANRVHVTLAGGTLVLQGHLRPAEHQALLNKLRFLPDWARVTDDILPAP
jgi:serine/threonine protein kinase